MFLFSRYFYGLLGLCFFFFLIHFRLSGMGILSTIPKFKYNETYFNVTLKQILVPRWAESLGHISVIEFLVDELEILGFVAKRDEFGDLTLFTNVIGIMNPSADKFLILTCHFDTKYMDTSKEEDFIGATDGGVSCAIILNVIRSLNRFLLQEFSSRKDLGLVVSYRFKSRKLVMSFILLTPVGLFCWT